jgi:hypothetical protein
MDNVPSTHDLGNVQEMELGQLWNSLIKHLKDRLAAKGQQLPGNHLYPFLTRVLEADSGGKGNEIPTFIDRASGIILQDNLMHYFDILAEYLTKTQVSPQEDGTDRYILVTNDPQSTAPESAELKDPKESEKGSRSKVCSVKDTDASLPKAEGAADIAGRPTDRELEKESAEVRDKEKDRLADEAYLAEDSESNDGDDDDNSFIDEDDRAEWEDEDENYSDEENREAVIDDEELHSDMNNVLEEIEKMIKGLLGNGKARSKYTNIRNKAKECKLEACTEEELWRVILGEWVPVERLEQKIKVIVRGTGTLVELTASYCVL